MAAVKASKTKDMEGMCPRRVNMGCRRETPTGSLRAWRLHEGEADRMQEVRKEKGPFKAAKSGVWVPGRKAAGVAVTVPGANKAEESRDPCRIR